MSRAALDLLACKAYYHASTPEDTLLARWPMGSSSSTSRLSNAAKNGSPIPALSFLLPSSLSLLLSKRGYPADNKRTTPDAATTNMATAIVTTPTPTATATQTTANPTPASGSAPECCSIRVVTSGSLVDRISCVVACSLVPVVVIGATDNITDTAVGSDACAEVATRTLRPQAEHTLDDERKPRTSCPGRGTGRGSASASSQGGAITGDYYYAVGGSPLSASGATQLERSLAMVLRGVSGAISAARLLWRDVSNLRVYYHLGQDSIRNYCKDGPVGSERAHVGCGTKGKWVGDEGGGELLERAFFLALAATTLERPAVTFVPIAGLADGARVCIHATALSLDRLKTELWVRGAA